MLPIHSLLSRIRWDPEFGRGEFALGYYDRVLDAIVRVSFAEIVLVPDRSDVIQVLSPDGDPHTVPLHRIKEVYKDGALIWQRLH